MKEFYQNHLSLILLFAVFLLIPFTACDSDDDDDPLVPETFLELYDGTKWVHVEDGITVYLRLNDNLQIPIEMWISELVLEKGKLANECYYYSNDWMDDGVKITENSRNRFTITYMEIERWSFTIQGESLVLTYTDAGGQEPPIVFQETTENVDDLEICPEEF